MLVEILISGCDDSTAVAIETNEEGLRLLTELRDKCNSQQRACKPTISFDEHERWLRYSKGEKLI